MTRTLIPFALCLGVLLGACSGSSDSTVVLWHAYRGDEASALEKTIEAYRSQPDSVPVRVVSVPYDAFANKLRVSVPRGNGPDLFIFAHDQVGDWAERGLIESLSFWADKALLEQYLDETLEPLVFDDALFGLPLAFKCLALFYDTGYASKPPKTMDELIATAKETRAERADVWGLGYSVDNFYYHAAWLHGFQGRVLGGGQHPQVRSDAMARSLTFARKLVTTQGLIPPELSPALMTSLFNDRKMVYVINGPWFRGEIGERDGWGVAPLPRISDTGQPAQPYLGVEALMMSANSVRKQAAFQVMRALTTDSAAYVRWREARQLVANRAVYLKPDVRNDAFSTAFRAQLSQTVPMSNGPAMRHVWSPLKSALIRAVVQGDPVDASLEEAERAIKRVMK